MKTLSVLITSITVFLFASNSTKAQEALNEGKYMIGGSVYLNTSNNESEYDISSNVNSEYYLISISPYAGKFIKDKLMAGIILSTTISSNDSYRSDTANINFSNSYRDIFSIETAVFLRKFWPIKEKFGAFIQPQIGYSYLNHEELREFNNFNSSHNINTHSVSLIGSLGLYYFVTDRFSLEATLGSISAFKNFSTSDSQRSRDNETTRRKYSDNAFSLNFVNTISLNQVFRINYYF